MDNKKPISIYVVEQRGSGGMIHYAYQLCSAMAKEGVNVSLITSDDYELEDLPHNFNVCKLLRLWPQVDPSLSKPPQNNLEIILRKLFWTIRRSARAIRLITQWVRLTKYLIKMKPDIVQFGSTEFPFEVIFLRYLKRNGLILGQICHEFEQRVGEDSLIRTLSNQFYSDAFQTFSTIFLHGEANRKRFLELFDIPPERLHLIPLGNEQIFQMPLETEKTSENLRMKYGLTPHDKVILFFGNITPSKGVPDLVKAFQQVHMQDKQVKLIIAGMPSKEMDMRHVINLTFDLGVSDIVVFDTRYIPMNEVGPLMQLGTVVVYPYLNSTQSAALQTAYTFGKPVVTTNVGGLPEAVDDGKSGYLVPPNSPELLGNAILKIISNPLLAKEMGAYAKHLSATRFAWKPIAKQIINIYRESLY